MPAGGAAVQDDTISRGVVDDAGVSPCTGGGAAWLQVFPAHRIGQIESPHVAQVPGGSVAIEHQHLISQRVVNRCVRHPSGWRSPAGLGPRPDGRRSERQHPGVIEEWLWIGPAPEYDRAIPPRVVDHDGLRAGWRCGAGDRESRPQAGTLERRRPDVREVVVR